MTALPYFLSAVSRYSRIIEQLFKLSFCIVLYNLYHQFHSIKDKTVSYHASLSDLYLCNKSNISALKDNLSALPMAYEYMMNFMC